VSCFPLKTWLTRLELIEPLQDNIEELSQAIAQWCKQQGHSRHQDALHQVLQVLSSATVEKLLGTNPDSVETPDSPLNKLTLQNAIGQSSL
jgi:hypothetical protein